MVGHVPVHAGRRVPPPSLSAPRAPCGLIRTPGWRHGDDHVCWDRMARAAHSPYTPLFLQTRSVTHTVMFTGHACAVSRSWVAVTVSNVPALMDWHPRRDPQGADRARAHGDSRVLSKGRGCRSHGSAFLSCNRGATPGVQGRACPRSPRVRAGSLRCLSGTRAQACAELWPDPCSTSQRRPHQALEDGPTVAPCDR